MFKDGALAVSHGRIFETGPYKSLKDIYPDAHIIKHKNTALLPPLVNAHTHLELSHIKVNDDLPATGFTNWIEQLLNTREQLGAVGQTVEDAAQKLLDKQYNQGVICIGDIGNTDIGEQLAKEFPGRLLHFHEMLGRSEKSRKSILEKVSKAPNSKLFTAHAPYSTHAELIKALKKRSRQQGLPFPIHTAEPPSENELLTSGTGELFEFLSKRKFIDQNYKPPAGIDNLGSVKYLHSLNVLDELTICVHCIHVSDAEIKILSESGTKVCLCPGSNRHLNVGCAPVKKFLDNGILPALGTDSRASNPEISIWREMKILNQDHPDIQPEQILAMATLGGARALGLDNDHGTLDKGKKAQFLAVRIPENMDSTAQVAAFLTMENNSTKPVWINEQ